MALLGEDLVDDVDKGDLTVVDKETRVVVVEADQESPKSVSTRLRAWGYQVVRVAGTVNAPVLSASRPDVLLIDMSSTHYESVELTRQVKATRSMSGVAIVGLTSHADEEAERRMLQAGADDFISRQATRWEYVLRIEGLLRMRRTARALADANAALKRGAEERARQLSRADYLLSRTLDALPAHIAIIDSDGIVTAVNDAWREFARENGGNTTTYHVGEPYLQMQDEDEMLEWQERFDELLNWRTAAIDAEYECATPSGTRWFHVKISALQAGSVTYCAAVHNDITESRTAALALQESEGTFRSLVATAPALITTIARNGDVHFSNMSAVDGETRLRRSPPYNNAFDYVALEHRHLMEGAMDRAQESRQVQTYEALALMPSGQQCWTESFVRYIQGEGEDALFLFYTSDISERRATEAELEDSRVQLHQSQKLEAVGALAGGVAHDFNNLLTIIMSSCSQLLKAEEVDEEHRKNLDEIMHATERAASLTGQLLAFARHQPLEIAVFDLEANLQAIQSLLRRTIGEHIEFMLRLSGTEARIEASPSQIDQVLVNLVVNARDAMPGGGRLEVACEVVPGQEGTESSGQDFVVLTVSDNGAGMDAVTRSRIFEPFYSTKLRGEGTGLGLATCYGIVASAGGRIGVESELGHGTTFTIRFPLSQKPLDGTYLEESNATSLAGSEVVLIVEDDRAIRRMLRVTFEDAGYEVIVTRHGEEALEEFAAAEQEIDLLFSDVLLPGISGFGVAQAILQKRPELPVLLASGYVGDAGQERFRLPDDILVMRKPFTGFRILREARKLLDAPRRNASTLIESPRQLEARASRPRVLIIDDERALRAAFSRSLSSEFAVVEAGSASEAMSIIESGPPIDALLCDLQLGETSGIALFEKLQEHHGRLAQRTLFVTGGATDQESEEFVRQHADRIIKKPVPAEVLRQHLVQVLAR